MRISSACATVMVRVVVLCMYLFWFVCLHDLSLVFHVFAESAMEEGRRKEVLQR